VKLSNRLYKKQPREELRNQIEALRVTLQGLLVQLGHFQEQAGIRELNDESGFSVSDDTHNVEWDDIADESGTEDEDTPDGNGPSGASYADNMPTIDDPTYPENRTLILPSNKNADQTYSSVELLVRQDQAKSELNFLQDLIAEKSFQYSGVIRVGRKQMKLRSRNLLRQMNHEIAIHCTVYNRCWNNMIRLGADKTMLEEHFKVLTKEDIKTSTAILDPNRPSSTQLKLSWLWHTVRTRILPPRALNLSPATTQPEDPATTLECKLMCYSKKTTTNEPQLHVCIGYVPEHRQTGGMKSVCFSHMKCDGPSNPSSIKVRHGGNMYQLAWAAAQ